MIAVEIYLLNAQGDVTVWNTAEILPSKNNKYQITGICHMKSVCQGYKNSLT